MQVQQEKPPVIVKTPLVPAKSKSRLGVVITVLALAALTGLAWYLTRQPSAGGMPGAGGRPGMGAPGPGGFGRPATTVGVAVAEKADLPVIVEALGTVTAGSVATVRPQVSGVLKEVLYKEGQMVKAGQVLAVIDPRPFEIALMQATGQRQRDEAQLENAKLTLERYRTLLEQDSIARQEVDTQAALVKQLEGTVMADRATERSARLNLDYTRVTAPISGRVGLRVVDVGNTVSSGDASGIAVITQTEPIDVQFAVPQDRIGELRASLAAGGTLEVEALDRTRQEILAKGVFLAMDNAIDTQTGTVRAKARFENKEHTLFPNQFVNVRLVVRTIKDAVVIPVSALRHSSTSGDYVYVLDADTRTVALRPVKAGISTVTSVQIVSGLQAGEKVITEGADRLKDGASVVLPDDNPRAGPPASGEGKRGQSGNNGSADRGGMGRAKFALDGADRPQRPQGPDGQSGRTRPDGGQGERRRRPDAEGAARQ